MISLIYILCLITSLKGHHPSLVHELCIRVISWDIPFFSMHAAEDLFFLSPPPSVTVPDIPALNVTRVEENGDLFYTVEGERGVYRSAPITSACVYLSVCLSVCLSEPFTGLMSPPNTTCALHVNSCQFINACLALALVQCIVALR